MTEEFDRLKETLRKPVTPEAMREAADRFREYEEAKKAGGKPMSKPMLVSLGRLKGYPNAVPVDKISDELGENPAFYNLMKRIISKEKA